MWWVRTWRARTWRGLCLSGLDFASSRRHPPVDKAIAPPDRISPVQFQHFGPDGIKTVKVPQWLAVLIAIGVAALALVLFVLAASAALVLLPVLALVGLIYGWWLRRKLRAMPRDWEAGPERRPQEPHDTIDADFVVVEPETTPSRQIDAPRPPPPADHTGNRAGG